jgi:hypothetical protein
MEHGKNRDGAACILRWCGWVFNGLAHSIAPSCSAVIGTEALITRKAETCLSADTWKESLETWTDWDARWVLCDELKFNSIRVYNPRQVKLLVCCSKRIDSTIIAIGKKPLISIIASKTEEWILYKFVLNKPQLRSSNPFLKDDYVFFRIAVVLLRPGAQAKSGMGWGHCASPRLKPEVSLIRGVIYVNSTGFPRQPRPSTPMWNFPSPS